MDRFGVGPSKYRLLERFANIDSHNDCYALPISAREDFQMTIAERNGAETVLSQLRELKANISSLADYDDATRNEMLRETRALLRHLETPSQAVQRICGLNVCKNISLKPARAWWIDRLAGMGIRDYVYCIEHESVLVRGRKRKSCFCCPDSGPLPRRAPPRPTIASLPGSIRSGDRGRRQWPALLLSYKHHSYLCLRWRWRGASLES